MITHPLLAENEGKLLNIRLPLLVCFALFVAWQMGVGYYSGNTLSIGGRTPLPIDVGNLTVLIVAGYILSIAFMIVLPGYIVWAERMTTGAALLSVLALYMPFAPEISLTFFSIHYFCGCLMIGFESAIIVNLFTEKTAIKHLLLAYAIANIFIVILHNDIFRVPFSVFWLFTVIALALMLAFFFKLPAKTWPRYVKKDDKIVAPKSFIFGILTLAWLTNFFPLFGNAIAESVPYGLMVLYASSVACGIIVFVLWKKAGITPLKSGMVILAITAIGFVVAITSLFIPELSLVACALLGVGMVCWWLSPFFCLLIVKRYPSKYLVPAMLGLAFIAVFIQTILLDALRNDLTMLYVVYLSIAVVLIIIYFMLEPYLLYSFRGRTLQDMIGLVAEEGSAQKPVPLQTTTPQAAPVAEAVAQSEGTHEQRMKTLLTHALSPLTRREYQVTDCIMRGLRRSEIAKEMDVLPETITKFTNNIYSKFDIHRRQDLFRLAEKLEKEYQ